MVFFRERRRRFGPLPSATRVHAIERLAAMMFEDPAWRRVEHVAYGLATVHHETAGTYEPIEEYADGSAYEGRGDLGNAEPGDGARFKGRGFVQLTGRVNYGRASRLLGIDLVELPELALGWMPAYAIMTRGMYGDGLTFTGRKLQDFDREEPDNFNYVQARRIINGLDCAGRIARNAMEYAAILEMVVP